VAKNTIRIFVASSTEGAPVAHALRKSLHAELGGGRALVELWSHKFEYGDTAIEALEAVAEHADFAVVVMTPDDKTSSREDIDQPAPRDNLVFELGLFIGALGRERSIVARDFNDALKVPSDILSVTALTFDSASPDSLDVSLQAECVRLAERIEHLGPRPKGTAPWRRTPSSAPPSPVPGGRSPTSQMAADSASSRSRPPHRPRA
jgi:CRP/FNR family cyclic AMP-dependent transcriptional regulator